MVNKIKCSHILVKKQSEAIEILDKIKMINSCLNEFISIEDIETEIIESMKDIKKDNFIMRNEI